MISILARFDVQTNAPVVFLADSVDYEHNKIKAWYSADMKVSSKTIDYYNHTKPLSAADEQIMRDRYAQAIGNNDVVVRHRLPRVNRNVPSILSVGVTPAVQAPQAAQQAVVIPMQPAQPKRRGRPPARIAQQTVEQAGPANPYAVDIQAVCDAIMKSTQEKIDSVKRAAGLI